MVNHLPVLHVLYIHLLVNIKHIFQVLPVSYHVLVVISLMIKVEPVENVILDAQIAHLSEIVQHANIISICYHFMILDIHHVFHNVL